MLSPNRALISLGYEPWQLTGDGRGALENNVAACDLGGDLRAARRHEHCFQLGDGQHVFPPDIDSAQQGDMSGAEGFRHGRVSSIDHVCNRLRECTNFLQG
jgi:hypothetical protein